MNKKKIPILNNKKGDGVHTGFLAIYIMAFGAILIIMAYVLYTMTNSYLAGFAAYEPTLPERIYAYRATNICLAYQDPNTGRYYPGIIDFSKYTQENLDSCFEVPDGKSFNVQLRDNTLQKDYDRILVGFGATLRIKTYPVIIRYDDYKVNKGELLFGVS